MNKMRSISTRPVHCDRPQDLHSNRFGQLMCRTLCHVLVFFGASICLPLWGQAPKSAIEFGSPITRDNWLLVRGEAVFHESQVELRGGSTLAWSDFTFTDFAVDLKYRIQGPNEVEAGFYLHGQLDPDTHRLQGKKFTFPTPQNARRRLSRNRTRQLDSPAARAWQNLRIECVGDRVLLFRNGVSAGTFHINQPEGHFAMSAAGNRCSTIAFKDVVITELSHQSLFNGHDLQGWQGAEGDAAACWEVRDGQLLCTGAPGPWLRSDATVGDFNLRLQYKLLEGGNSGVYVRVPADGRHHGAGAGLEVQILDDRSDRYRDLKPYQFSGGLYAVVPPKPGTARPVGQWNALEINCRGRHYRVTHNGIVVVDTTDRKYRELSERLVNGYIGLQNHSESVWFRDIRIGPAH